jgi:hypothetical protein
MDILKDFINSISMPKAIHESVDNGFNAIFEGYADVRDIEGVVFDAFDKAQRFAAQQSPAMDLILRSQKKLEDMYTEDSDSPLDNRPTSPFNQYVEYTYNDRGDAIEDSLGLTAADLAVRGKQANITVKKQNTRKKASSASLDFSDFL